MRQTFVNLLTLRPLTYDWDNPIKNKMKKNIKTNSLKN
jgi:hypothetical protein